jgi:prepilin peptidase CpaA
MIRSTEDPECRMALQLQLAALLGFAALMLIAAIEDLRRLTIPNALTASLGLLWPFYILAAPSWIEIAGSIAAAILVFLAGALAFSRGYLGGGDVKLLAAAALWAGPGGTPMLFALTGVLGGMLALLLLMPPGAHIAALARAKLGPSEASAKSDATTPVPYGIAIAAAAMLVIFLPHFR